MLARHHVAVAAGLSAVAAAGCYRQGVGGVDLAAAVGFVAVGAGAGLAPDVDEPGSSAPRTFGWLGRGSSWLVRKVVRKHRGATHTVEVMAAWCAAMVLVGQRWPAVTAVICGLCVAVGLDTVRGVSSPQALAAGGVVGYWVLWSVAPGEWWPAAAVAVGWVAHLLTDTPTPHGVPWTVFALPGDHRLSFRLFRTGSVWEPLVAWPLAAAGFVVAAKISGVTYDQALQLVTGAGRLGS